MNTEYKLLSYADGDLPRAGILVGDSVIDAATALGLTQGSTLTVHDILRDWSAMRPKLAEAARAAAGGAFAAAARPLAEVRLLAPVEVPGAVYGAGANFADHVDEMRRAMNLPQEPSPRENGGQPWFFLKSPTAGVIANPGERIALPAYSKSVDYEAELVAVIGRAARNVSVADALDYVAGYTIANDLSARDAVKRTNFAEHSPFRYDWLSHKCFEQSCPTGPWIAPADFVGDPQDLGMQLWLNGGIRQDGTTRTMIFSVAEQVAFLSSRTTLRPGDLILTGTPAGVGTPRGEFLKAGDHVRIRIDKIGEFENTFA
jgi:2-keto-4-pentenoate hydratase/2-oxohepta-3-ene-1,7-dioic acid hydratase in catechol pathway